MKKLLFTAIIALGFAFIANAATPYISISILDQNGLHITPMQPGTYGLRAELSGVNVTTYQSMWKITPTYDEWGMGEFTYGSVGNQILFLWFDSGPYGFNSYEIEVEVTYTETNGNIGKAKVSTYIVIREY